MSEKILGVLQVTKTVYGLYDRTHIAHKELIITSDRILVIRKWEQYFGPPASDIFDALSSSADRKTAESKREMRERERQAKTLEELARNVVDNLVIPNSKITKVELRKGLLGGKSIKIITNHSELKYAIVGLNNRKKGVKFEDYESVLRPVFGDKLSVKK